MNIFKWINSWRGNDRRKLGNKGEKIAERYLKKKGMRRVDKNLRTSIGEIDLLMWDQEVLVVVEVRTATMSGDETLEMKLPYSKKKKLSQLARFIESKLAAQIPPIRIDFCLVTMQPEIKVQHIPDAFHIDSY